MERPAALRRLRRLFAAGEEISEALNTFILTSNVFNGTVDTDAALLDSAQPQRMLPTSDSGDHLHPSEAGMQAIANRANLSLFSSL